jgi:hypothetical protein
MLANVHKDMYSNRSPTVTSVRTASQHQYSPGEETIRWELSSLPSYPLFNLLHLHPLQ